MTPKPKPPPLSPESLLQVRQILTAEKRVRARALELGRPAAEIVAACDRAIASILETYPEATQ
ncbi:hypothetical protein [Arthrobacter sp. GMC3]|uniref:hypothetical protein n=1 Tax=Arthrobacter sp. GMC3 TaxID=2058894 RepID=UPI000CE553B4|nr:hypothetical protein [Arthrobacter sp. GMC3]